MARPNGRDDSSPSSGSDYSGGNSHSSSHSTVSTLTHPTPDSSGRFDPADFIIPAQDTKGHSERVWCRVQPGHDRQIDILLQSKKWPYRTKGDIHRHAIHRHIQWLLEMGPVDSVMAHVEMMVKTVRANEERAQFLKFFEELGRTLNNFIGMNAIGEARKLVAQIRGDIQTMPDNFWRAKYLGELEAKFLHILDDPSPGQSQDRRVQMPRTAQVEE